MSSDALEREWLWGGAAARAFGTKDPRSVWLAVERYGAEFPGRIEVVTFGRGKMARREDLEAFTAWFLAGPGKSAENLRRARRGGPEETAPPELVPEGAGGAIPTTTAADVASSVAPVAGRLRAAVTDERRALLARRIEQLTR